MDRNGNGVLDDDEVSDRARGFIDRIKERAGYTDKGPVNIDKLASAYKKQTDDGEPGTVPGFGEDPGLDPALGFDAPPPLGDLALENKFDQKTIDTVNSMLEKYDKDKNGFLDGYEWAGARWRTPPEGSDLNKDGKLDRLELAKRVSGFSAPREEENKDDRGSDGRGSGDDQIKKSAKSMMYQYDKDKSGYLEKEEWFKSDLADYDKNKDGKISTDELASRIAKFASRSSFGSRSDGEKVDTYRFLSPLERLPKGLPSWFNDNDLDEDGQIHMSEYASTWSDSKAEEFTRYDLNGDGFITPNEALAADGKPVPSNSSLTSTASTSRSSSSPSSSTSDRGGDRGSDRGGERFRGGPPGGFGGGGFGGGGFGRR